MGGANGFPDKGGFLSDDDDNDGGGGDDDDVLEPLNG